MPREDADKIGLQISFIGNNLVISKCDDFSVV